MKDLLARQLNVLREGVPEQGEVAFLLMPLGKILLDSGIECKDGWIG